MKKAIALLLCLALTAGLVPALAETGAETADAPAVFDTSIFSENPGVFIIDRPESSPDTAFIKTHSFTVGRTDDDLIVTLRRFDCHELIVFFQRDGDLAVLTDRFKFHCRYAFAQTVPGHKEQITFDFPFAVDRDQRSDFFIFIDVDDIDDWDTFGVA